MVADTSTNGMTLEDSSTRRRIRTDKYSQQAVPSLRPLITSCVVLRCLFATGVVFMVVGISIKSVHSNEVFQRKAKYNDKIECKITQANEGRVCNVTIKAKHKMNAPTYVYYEVANFYQNHERYMTSRSTAQLLGRNKKKSDLSDCSPLKKNGSKVLSPCGLVANTMFNDVIRLVNPDKTMREDSIAWGSDLHDKFKQPNKFEWATTEEDVSGCYKSYCDDAICKAAGVSTPCMGYICRGGDFESNKCSLGQHVVYYYKRADYYQFLYQTFPEIISPIVGVKNEHFVVWMQPAGLSTFRKLYGRITHDIKEDEVLFFEVTNNFDVSSFNGKKYIVISTTSSLGANPKVLWLSFFGYGAVSIFFAALIGLKLKLGPRQLGDTSYLHTD